MARETMDDLRDALAKAQIERDAAMAEVVHLRTLLLTLRAVLAQVESDEKETSR